MSWKQKLKSTYSFSVLLNTVILRLNQGKTIARLKKDSNNDW